MFGALFIFGGIMGSLCFGVWVEIKKVYKLSYIIICAGSTISLIGLTFALLSGDAGLVTFVCFVVGFFMISILSVGIEYAVEVTYPIEESISTGMLTFFGNIVGIIFVRTQYYINFADRGEFIHCRGRWQSRRLLLHRVVRCISLAGAGGMLVPGGGLAPIKSWKRFKIGSDKALYIMK